MLTTPQLLCIHHNPSCDGCARDVEEKTDNVSLVNKT